MITNDKEYGFQFKAANIDIDRNTAKVTIDFSKGVEISDDEKKLFMPLNRVGF